MAGMGASFRSATLGQYLSAARSVVEVHVAVSSDRVVEKSWFVVEKLVTAGARTHGR